MRKISNLFKVLSFLAVSIVAAHAPLPAASDTCRAKVEKAEALLEKDDELSYEAAAEIFKKAAQAQYDCVPALVGYTHAITMAHGENITYEEYLLAYQYISRAIVLDSNNARAYWVMANLMRYTNRQGIALRLTDHSLTINPDDPWAHYVLGSILITINSEMAINELKKALELKPDWRRARHNLAVAYLYSNQTRKAEKILKLILNDNPNDINALTNLGITRFRMGKLDAAIEDFKKALAQNPNFPEALKGLGDVALAKKDYNTAVGSYEKYLIRYPDDARVLVLLGQAQEGVKDYAAARESYRKALDINPADEETNNRLEALPE